MILRRFHMLLVFLLASYPPGNHRHQNIPFAPYIPQELRLHTAMMGQLVLLLRHVLKVKDPQPWQDHADD
jgi:hypothetical protein